jgi:DNA ligase-1
MPKDTIPANHKNVLEFFKNECEIDDNGNIVTKTLYSIDKAGKFHYWNGYVGIAESNGSDDLISVDEELVLERLELPDENCGIYWTQYGHEGGVETTSASTYVVTGKNIGKNNETSPLTQAILDLRTLYNKKIKTGNSPDKTSLIGSGTVLSMEDLIARKGIDFPWRVYPMAVHDVSKASNWKHVKFPCDIQPKFDGIMLIVVSHPDIETTYGHIDAYSRRRETIENREYITNELKPILEGYPGLYVVGELWKSGQGRQDISGASRRLAKSEESKLEKQDFMIFDCFYTNSFDKWTDRKKILDEIKKKAESTTYIKFADNYIVKTKDELMKKYEEFLSQKLEGGIIRNFDSTYMFSASKEYRTYEVLKIKPREDGEWEVVGFSQGNKGKEVGQIKWICKHEDKTFAVSMNKPEIIRRAMFQYFTENPKVFEEKYKGQMMTITYDILSNDGLPQEAKALYFHDTKVEEQIHEEIEPYIQD